MQACGMAWPQGCSSLVLLGDEKSGWAGGWRFEVEADFSAVLVTVRLVEMTFLLCVGRMALQKQGQKQPQIPTG